VKRGGGTGNNFPQAGGQNGGIFGKKTPNVSSPGPPKTKPQKPLTFLEVLKLKPGGKGIFLWPSLSPEEFWGRFSVGGARAMFPLVRSKTKGCLALLGLWGLSRKGGGQRTKKPKGHKQEKGGIFPFWPFSFSDS